MDEASGEGGGEGDGEGDSDGDSEGDSDQEAVARHAALGAAGARHLRRLNSEQRQPFAEVHTSYLSELFSSPRFRSLPRGYRFGILQHVLQHYTARAVQRLSQASSLPVDEAGFIRRTRRYDKDRTNSWRAIAWPKDFVVRAHTGCATPGQEGVPSRGRMASESTDATRLSPSCGLRPCRYAGEATSKEAWQARSERGLSFALQVEAAAQLRCILDQYPVPSHRVERCLREQSLLALAVGDELDAPALTSDISSDQAVYHQQTQLVLQSPLLTTQLAAVTGAWEAWAGHVLHIEPGEALQSQHDPACIDATLDENPTAVLLLRKLWLLQAEPSRPFGRLPRAPSSRRAAVLRSRKSTGVARRGKRHIPGAKARGGESSARIGGMFDSGDSAVSSASDDGVRLTPGLPPVTRVLPEACAEESSEFNSDASGDEDDTQPTAPAHTARCGFCDKGSRHGSLWWCQVCGDHVCHEQCCLTGVAWGASALSTLKHACSACTSSRKLGIAAEEQFMHQELVHALADVAAPLPLSARLTLAREKDASGSCLVSLQHSLRLLVERTGACTVGVPGEVQRCLLLVACLGGGNSCVGCHRLLTPQANMCPL